MADVRAFKGRFYDTEKAGGIESLFAPPYDVISPGEQRGLLDASPYNVVRLILPDDPTLASPAWQEEASRRFEDWKRRGVFDTSGSDSVYFYRQTFDLPGGRRLSRTALIALYKLEELGRDGIYPHEHTFPRVTEEQLALLRACSASFSQVFTLFEDGPAYHQYLAERALPASRRLFSFEDDRGLGHEVWELSDPGLIRELREHLRDRRIFIADGHHRYETSLLYRNERRAEAGPGGEEPWDFISMAFIGLSDPGLVLLPVHRLLKCDALPYAELPGLLEPHCALRKVEGPGREERVREACAGVLSNTGARPRFGLVTPEEVYLVDPLRLDEDLEGLEREHSRDWAELDVTVLHEVVLRRYLGLGDPGDPSRPFEVKYTVDLDEVVSATAGGGFSAGFLVRSPSLQAAWKIASLDEKMPHKSTYFYPKMPSGLVIYDHTAGQPQMS
jgi:uncharacterized protein (DUF1015 family)